ncbi:recombinase family protein [Jiangella muralis]|uniref:recombinase family protein n=1 Tax=Jiangella muralis TaxID=702383 RepID=UPI00069F165A|nr:recombinase family protein [Jiangella muralis]
MTIIADTLTGRQYVRSSVKKDRSIAGQQHDNQHACAGHGITLADRAYVDNDRSASRYATKVREGYDELMGDLLNGRFTDDVLVLWESSRGSRRVGEWVLLIDVLAEQGKRVLVTEDDRLYDPANGNDRHDLIGSANDAEKEAWKIKERVNRGMAQAARDGKMHGGQTSYGYRKVYDPATGKLIGTEIDESEAPIVRELFRRVREGNTLASITRDFEQRGIRSRSGKVLSHQTLRGMLTRPVYTALRINKGKEFDGNWPAIVDRETWAAVQRILTGPDRVASPNAGKLTHEFSHAVKCDVCGSGLTVGYERKATGEYRCAGKGCISGIDKPTLDAAMRGVVFAYLAREADSWETAAENENAEIRAVRAEIEKLTLDREQLADKVASGAVSLEFAARVENGLTQRLTAAQARERELSMPSELRDLLGGSTANIEATWDAMPIAARRRVASMMLSPSMAGQPRIMRKPVRNKVIPVADRIRWAKG